MKRTIFVFVFAFAAFAAAHGQQLTRFAVVDMAKVYTTFFLQSEAVRRLEADAAKVQADINRMTGEIEGLRSSRLSAFESGNQAGVLRLDNEIREKTEYLREFHAVRTAELESRRRTLARADEFLGEVYGEIRAVAESEGFTMVLDLGSTTGILWYSPTVDITDRLIQRLLSR